MLLLSLAFPVALSKVRSNRSNATRKDIRTPSKERTKTYQFAFAVATANRPDRIRLLAYHHDWVTIKLRRTTIIPGYGVARLSIVRPYVDVGCVVDNTGMAKRDVRIPEESTIRSL
jgi:hypothetical protein